MNGANLGLTDDQCRTSIEALNTALANANVLLIKTKKAHWDVMGPEFFALHKLWEEQYVTIADYVDELAERVRMLGGIPVATARGFLENSELSERPGRVDTATEAVAALLEDHETIVRNLRRSCDMVEADVGTVDMMTAMLRGHEKMAWMLRASLQGEALKTNGRTPMRAAPPLA
jgi:starvation-inducible DNA-binding protein